jgi:hypothetical protein
LNYGLAVNQLQVHQIVGLKQDNFCLYCEIIQLIPQRQYCWVRPILLVFLSDTTDPSSSVLTAEKITDLRDSSDLLLPWSLFQPALDTEIIPLFSKIQELNSISVNKIQARQELNFCLKKIWQANRNLFEAV